MNKRYDYKELYQYRKDITWHSTLTREQEFELAKKYRQGDKAAGQQLINANLRFVVKVSGKYFKSGYSQIELIQEGNYGLLKALEKYDPDRGVPFVYYAAWWIEAMIKDYIYKGRKANTGKLGFAKDLLSLDEPIGNDDNEKNCWVDYLPSDIDIEKKFFDDERCKNMSSVIKKGLTVLSEREAFIIKERFYADPPRTLVELASKLGISKERVRQLESRSLEKIKQTLEGKGLSVSDLESIGTYSNQSYGLSSFAYGEIYQN